MSIDMKVFSREVERLKQHIESSRDQIGSEVANRLLGNFGNGDVLDQYFRHTIEKMAVDVLDRVSCDLSNSGVVGTSGQTEIDGWNELRAIYRDWRLLVESTGDMSYFTLAYFDYKRLQHRLQTQR